MSRSSTSTDRRVAALRGGFIAVAALWLAGCATSPEPDPTEQRIADLDERVGRIDRVVSNQSLVQLAQRVDGLQNEVRSLSGRIEELQNANEQLKRQQRDLYADLDQRLKAAPPAPTDPASGGAPAVGGGDEQAQYNRAFDHLKSGDYTGAITAFRALATAYPQGQLADNTQYWLGEAYYVTRDYANATGAFERVLSTFPNSRKAPDALLKLAYTQIEQKRVDVARTTLQQVVSRFPGTDAARLATERLQKLAPAR
ncbi:MAG: tol-pal system protein YbgF [Steroidobacteraceae bacterium]